MPSESDPNEFTIHEANLALYQCLSTATPKRKALPAELILQILEHPTRWVCTYATAFPDPEAPESRAIRVPAGFDNRQANIQVVLSTEPLAPAEIGRLRSVVFTFTSKDQGWSSYPDHHGTYENTWSWFEAGLRPQTRGGHGTTARGEGGDERGEEVGRYERFHLQRNRHAGREQESYRIELGLDSPLLRRMEAGDVIDLLACAQCAGWENQVFEASIEIWSFDDIREQEA